MDSWGLLGANTQWLDLITLHTVPQNSGTPPFQSSDNHTITTLKFWC